LAIEAGATAFGELLDPSHDRAAKEKGIDDMLDEYVSFDTRANCTAANHWCDAPENAYGSSSCACRSAGAGTRGATRASALGVGLIGGLAWGRRRRRGRRGDNGANRSGISSVLGILACLGFWFTPRGALADTAGIPANGPDNKGPVKALEGESNSGAPNTVDPAGAFFARLALGASYDKPGFAGGLGLRYQLGTPWMLGFDAEINPFVTKTPRRLRTGVANAYVSLIRRFQLKNDSINVRSQVGLGASVLLIDLVGAPAGSYGPFFGLSFLGVEWKVARGFYLTVDPTYLAFPVPHLTGAPFGYLQYRFLLGLEFGG